MIRQNVSSEDSHYAELICNVEHVYKGCNGQKKHLDNADVFLVYVLMEGI